MPSEVVLNFLHSRLISSIWKPFNLATILPEAYLHINMGVALNTDSSSYKLKMESN